VVIEPIPFQQRDFTPHTALEIRDGLSLVRCPTGGYAVDRIVAVARSPTTLHGWQVTDSGSKMHHGLFHRPDEFATA